MAEMTNQPTARPTRKLQYTALVGALTWALTLGVGYLLGMPELPVELAAGVPILAGTLAGYVVRERKED